MLHAQQGIQLHDGIKVVYLCFFECGHCVFFNREPVTANRERLLDPVFLELLQNGP